MESSDWEESSDGRDHLEGSSDWLHGCWLLIATFVLVQQRILLVGFSSISHRDDSITSIERTWKTALTHPSSAARAYNNAALTKHKFVHLDHYFYTWATFSRQNQSGWTLFSEKKIVSRTKIFARPKFS